MRPCPECGGRLLDDTGRVCACCGGNGQVPNWRYALFGWPWYPWWPRFESLRRERKRPTRAERLNARSEREQRKMLP